MVEQEKLFREERFEIDGQTYSIDASAGYDDDFYHTGITMEIIDSEENHVCKFTVKFELLNVFDPFTVAGTAAAIYGSCVFLKNSDSIIKIINECWNSSKTNNPSASNATRIREIYECVLSKKHSLRADVQASLLSCLTRLISP